MDIEENQYLLVSDSDEIHNRQWDSKKLKQTTFEQMAQNDLFKKHLLIMNDYLTNLDYDKYVETLNTSFDELKKEFDFLSKQEWCGKFRVVDGQVILIKANQVPLNISPIDYVRQYWDITQEYQVIQIMNGMLRGVVEVHNRDNIQHQENLNVVLKKDEIPSHMHQSGLTENARISCLHISDKTEDKLGVPTDGIVYDMFYNDSFSTGLSDNELDGVVDSFAPNTTGLEDGVSHNNLPTYSEFYAFEVRKII